MMTECYVASQGRYPVRFINLTEGRAIYEITSVSLATKFPAEDLAAAKARHYRLQPGWCVCLVADYRPCIRCGQERSCTAGVCDECAGRTALTRQCRLCPTHLRAGQELCPTCLSQIQTLTHHE